jgi:hypothetical protein
MSEHPESAPSAVDDPGQSTTKSGETTGATENEPGRESNVDTQGASDRPVGTSESRDSTGVDPQETVTGGPTQPAGDQGG